MGFCGWFIFGGLAGWVASIILGVKDRGGCITYAVIGVVGAFIGGGLMSAIQGDFNGFSLQGFGFNWGSFGVAVLGSVILLVLTGATRKGRKKK